MVVAWVWDVSLLLLEIETSWTVVVLLSAWWCCCWFRCLLMEGTVYKYCQQRYSMIRNWCTAFPPRCSLCQLSLNIFLRFTPQNNIRNDTCWIDKLNWWICLRRFLLCWQVVKIKSKQHVMFAIVVSSSFAGKMLMHRFPGNLECIICFLWRRCELRNVKRYESHGLL